MADRERLREVVGRFVPTPWLTPRPRLGDNIHDDKK